MTEHDLNARQEEAERIFEIMQDGADLIQQLRNYLKYLEEQTNCPPRIVAKVKNEILKVAMDDDTYETHVNSTLVRAES